ncbi:MAG: hypothetical protein NC092_12720 [Butyrivibrio sp.]|nr:hypothetical protein [Butyrivibrio sp.]
MLERCKEVLNNCFEGDVTLTKLTLWLLAALCFTAGIVYGLVLAPWTRGVAIGCNNVKQDDCCFGGGCMQEDEED